MGAYYQDPNFMAYLVMGLFPIMALIFDAYLPRHKAVAASLMAGFLFLPTAQIDIGGALYWNRTTAPVFVVFAGILMRDGALLRTFRFRWFDLPMLGWCLAPLFAAVLNGLGLYEGASLGFYQLIGWGGPYFIGRLHFRSKEQLVDLAKILFIGGMIYTPLCALEIRLSPMLHSMLYGFHQHSFAQTVRGSLFRPTVFLSHGLTVGMWMAMTTYLGWVLSSTKLGSNYFGLPSKFWLLCVAIVFIACQSMGATFLAIAIWMLTVIARRTQGKTLLLLFALIPITWAVTRTTGILETSTLSDASSMIDEERARSLTFRLDAEDKLIRYAKEQPIFGWSNRAFNVVNNDRGREISVVADGLWIISFSAYGLIGLASMLLMYLVPILIVLKHAPPKLWIKEPMMLLTGSFAMVIGAVAIDSVTNAQLDPMFLLIMGAAPSALLAPLHEKPPHNPAAAFIGPQLPAVRRYGRVFGTHPNA
jgi:O-antigen ligase